MSLLSFLARHTTNSNHRCYKWKNLVKGIVLTSANQLWVSDITYIQLANGDVAYLHLVTDAYYKNSTILFIVSIKIGTKNKECLLFLIPN